MLGHLKILLTTGSSYLVERILQASEERQNLLQRFCPVTKIRERFQKSKWKFKMAFVIKGGGDLACH